MLPYMCMCKLSIVPSCDAVVVWFFVISTQPSPQTYTPHHGRGVHQPPNWRKRRFFRAAGEPFGTIALPLLDAVVPKCCKPRGKKSEKLESSKMVFFDICSALRSGESAEQKHNKFFSHHIPCILNSHSAIYLIPNWDYAAPICWKQAASALVASSVEAKLSTSIKSSWLCCKHGVT